MSTTGDINLGKFNVSSTDRFRVTITKDGVAWDLSSGTVQIVFESPDRSTQITRDMVAEDAANGIFYYDRTTSELNTEGTWTVGIRVVDSIVSMRYPHEISLKMGNHP